MSPKRIKQRFLDFEQALERLKEALSDDPKKTSTIIDGTIQRFEFTFELSWKLAQAILAYNGIETNNPRAVLKESFKEGLISDGEKWIQMLDDRNKTTHIYDEKEAVRIYQSIKNDYFSLLMQFRKKMIDATVKISD